MACKACSAIDVKFLQAIGGVMVGTMNGCCFCIIMHITVLTDSTMSSSYSRWYSSCLIIQLASISVGNGSVGWCYISVSCTFLLDVQGWSCESCLVTLDLIWLGSIQGNRSIHGSRWGSSLQPPWQFEFWDSFWFVSTLIPCNNVAWLCFGLWSNGLVILSY